MLFVSFSMELCFSSGLVLKVVLLGILVQWRFSWAFPGVSSSLLKWGRVLLWFYATRCIHSHLFRNCLRWPWPCRVKPSLSLQVDALWLLLSLARDHGEVLLYCCDFRVTRIAGSLHLSLSSFSLPIFGFECAQFLPYLPFTYSSSVFFGSFLFVSFSFEAVPYSQRLYARGGVSRLRPTGCSLGGTASNTHLAINYHGV